MVVTAAAGEKPSSPYGSAKTSVWWDIENCQVPRGSDAHVIAQNISSALADVGYRGAVTISAYGDTNKIPTAVQQALSSTGIALNHVPAGVKDASDKKILVDMLFWAVDNPPPANYLLISGDRDFSNALHQLCMRRYNILLAHAPNVSQALVAAAKRVWLWTSLLSGGPPRQTSDPSHPSNTHTLPNGSYSMKNEDNPRVGKAEVKVHPTVHISRTSSQPPASKEGHAIQSPKHRSMPPVSSSEARGSTHRTYMRSSTLCSSPQNQMPHSEPDPNLPSEGKQVFKFPHEFLGANNSKTSVGSAFNQPPRPGYPMNNWNIPNNQQTQFHNHSSFTPSARENAPPVRPACPANLPDLYRLDISKTPNISYQNNLFPHQSCRPPSYIQNVPPSYQEKVNGHQLNPMNGNLSSNGSGGAPSYQMSSGVIQGLIGNIRSALCELKVNKITPTEANLGDCIRYGMGIQNFNVGVALNCAVEHNVVVMHKLGSNLPFFVGKDDKLWNCVNPFDINVRYPEAVWEAVRNLLSSPHGQSAIFATECRYQAATVLKKSCIQHLSLGEILQILHSVVHVRKWIIPNSSGWQPLSFTLKVAS